MATRRSSQLTIGYCPTWKRQSAFDVPMPGSELTRAFPATSRNYLESDETTEDVINCTGEDFLFEEVLGVFERLQIDMDFDPDVSAGLIAFAAGVASPPSAGTSEVQTETVTATGGTRRLTVQTGANAQVSAALPYNESDSAIQTALENLSNVGAGDIVVSQTGEANEVQTETLDADVDGGTRTLTVEGQTTTPIAWDAADSVIQAALEALSNVAPGDITVTGSAGGPYTYTFGGAFAGSNRPLIVPDYTGLTDGGGPVAGDTSAIVQTTPGSAGTISYTFSSAMAQQDVRQIVVDTFNLTGGSSSITTTTPGVGREHEFRRIVGYTLPLMTLYVGFRGSDKQPVIFKNVIVNSWRVRSASREKVTLTVELIGSGDLQPAVAYTMPDCQDLMPIRFGDCKMFINGTDYIAANQGREFEYYYQNDVTPQFDGAGIYSTRHERADQRPNQYNLFVLGEPGDSIYNGAKGRMTTEVVLQLGPDGRNVTCHSSQTMLKLSPEKIRFGGDPPESEIALIGRPKYISGDADTPTVWTANVAQSATFLTSV